MVLHGCCAIVICHSWLQLSHCVVAEAAVEDEDLEEDDAAEEDDEEDYEDAKPPAKKAKGAAKPAAKGAAGKAAGGKKGGQAAKGNNQDSKVTQHIVAYYYRSPHLICG